MKHINYKIETLLHEGFSMKTLDSFSEGQLNLLYEKTKKIKKEPKEIINVKKGSPEEGNLMSKGVTYNTYDEAEVTEKAISKKQHGLMGAAYSVEKGDKDIKDIPKSYRKKVEKVVDSTSKKQVKDFAKTKTDKLPEKKEVKKLEENILRLIEDHLPPHTTKGELLSAIKKRNR